MALTGNWVNRVFQRLVTSVVGNPAVIQVDGDVFRRDAKAAPGLANVQYVIRVVFFNRLLDDFGAVVEFGWNLQLDNLGTVNGVRQSLDSFNRRVDLVVTKGVKTSN
jgi:hypothetical protein